MITAHNFPERRKPWKQKETHAPSLPPFYFFSVYTSTFLAVAPGTLVMVHTCCSIYSEYVPRTTCTCKNNSAHPLMALFSSFRSLSLVLRARTEVQLSRKHHTLVMGGVHAHYFGGQHVMAAAHNGPDAVMRLLHHEPRARRSSHPPGTRSAAGVQELKNTMIHAL